MKGVATDIGTIHFVGIGGIGMSGIAEVMRNLGYQVQGSDVAEGYVVQGLRDKGISVAIGHAAEEPGRRGGGGGVHRDSPRQPGGGGGAGAARAGGAPCGNAGRADAAEIHRRGRGHARQDDHDQHGGRAARRGGVDPTVINGGIINSYGSNARLGASDWMVVEADESDGSFLRLDGTIAVVTNIDPEHLDHYGDFDAVKNAFVEFVENVPFYGAALVCLDHPEVQNILPRVRDRRVVTYGFSAQADVRGVNVTPVAGGNTFEVIVRGRDGATRSIEGIELPMAGRHNVQNALAAVGVALELGIDDATIQRGFHAFGGVKRRFTKVGEVAVDGGSATIIDDYGHHPVEIRAVLAAAREGAGEPAAGRAGDRGGAAAPLFAAGQSDGRVPNGVQRR